MFKRSLLTVFTLIFVLSLTLMGCSNKNVSESTTKAPDNQEKVTLSALLYITQQTEKDAYTSIAKDFEAANPNIKVDLQFPGDYENVLKVKMAADDLPDVFDTHGWAQVRYGKYLADLKGENWVSRLTPTIKDVVTDKDGKIYALPISEAKDGITYNVKVLKKYNVEIPKTFDELMAAAEKIKKESNGEVAPFFFGGGTPWTVGQFFGYFANSMLISPKDNSAKALLDGSFDWSAKWTPLAAKLKEMFDKGYMNKDVITAKVSDIPRLFAQEKIAFSFSSPSYAEDAYKVNKDTQLGIMPVPSMVTGDEPSFSGGERHTMGIWKDSKHSTEAKKLLEFFAMPDNMAKIANIAKVPPGLTGIKVTHEFTTYYEQYATVRVLPYFDRVYLPSGMWDIMCDAGMDVIAGQSTPEKDAMVMKDNVARLSKK